MTADLTGKVIAVLCAGTEFDRALCVAAADAGAGVAMATVMPSDEFRVASIANEVWSIGIRQFLHLGEAADPLVVAAFSQRVMDELGRCDLAVASTWRHSGAPFEELSPDEWTPVLQANLTIPYLFLESFSKAIAARGSGRIAVVAPERKDADASERASRAGLISLVEDANRAWRGRDVTAQLVESDVESVLELVP